MAQVQDACGGRNAPQGATKTDREAFEMAQYEMILRFQEAILSGRHPTIRPLETAALRPSLGAAALAGEALRTRELPSSSAAAAKAKAGGAAVGSVAPGLAASPPPSAPSAPKPFATGNTEINPILLEKSEELVRAEAMLQRQRLERSLRDEVERRRAAKAPQPDKQNDKLDLSDVLSKALALVPAIDEAPVPAAPAAPAAPAPVEDGLADRQEAASDSFDDDTFYSSQHGTPQSHMTSRVRNATAEAQSATSPKHHLPMADGPPQALQPGGEPSASIVDAATRADGLVGAHASTAAAVPQASIVPGLNNYIGAGEAAGTPGQRATSGAQSQSEDSTNMDYEPPGAEESADAAQQQADDSYMEMHPPSPLVRGHSLQPVAPQPAQMSALAMAGQGQGANASAAARGRATPAQVAALRREHSAATSPDSSSQGGRGSDKKKGKKKKRKAERQVPDVGAASPYIKAEPRSPSPIFAPAYIKANKRQRQSQARAAELDSEPRDERVAAMRYGEGSAYAPRDAGSAYLGEARYVREYVDDYRMPAEVQLRGYAPPSAAFAVPYSPDMSFAPRQAPPPPPPAPGEVYRDAAGAYREHIGGGGRHVGGAEAEAPYAALPRPPPPRRVMDEFGREHFDPSHPAVQRSLAGSVPPGEPGLMYERLPARAASRQAGLEIRGDGVGYGGPAPAPPPAPLPPYTVVPRRVVTQPEYAPYDYRESRAREYSARPMAPQGDFVEVGPGGERRYMAEAAGHAARAASMMPVETVRYEMAPHGYGRLPSARPEVGRREYVAGGVRAESRHGTVQPSPYVGEYGGGPMGGEWRHRAHAPAGGEIAFIERPRGATQEIVYADDVRREVYR